MISVVFGDGQCTSFDREPPAGTIPDSAVAVSLGHRRRTLAASRPLHQATTQHHRTSARLVTTDLLIGSWPPLTELSALPLNHVNYVHVVATT